MSGARPGPGVDEFELIDRLLRPLAEGAPEALGLADDAAVIAGRPGFDLIATKDAMVAGVHFLPDDPLDLVARKLLRVNLSDLAAKGAEPYGYLLACAWPRDCGWEERARFADGLRQDQAAFGLKLFGGDTVSTPGPLTLSATLLGWVPAGGMVRRSAAQPGDLVLVSGTIGDGWLGLQAARGDDLGLDASQAAWLADRYRLPQPRLDLAAALRKHAGGAADISDGLIADAGHIAEASGVALTLELERLPLSFAAKAWLAAQADAGAALARLATGGDDYEIICTARADAADSLVAADMTVIGQAQAGQGVGTLHGGQVVALDRTGWRHG
jgi:thiamine-monophosphate kinase